MQGLSNCMNPDVRQDEGQNFFLGEHKLSARLTSDDLVWSTYF